MSRDRAFSYQPALDGLRAVAVGSVVFYHLGQGWAGGGFLGVDTFFVLSGYLITSLLLLEWAASGTIDFAAFWIRRARRLLPALLLVLAAIAVYAAVAVPSDELDQLRGDGLATLFYGANWRLIFSGQSYFDLFSEASPFRHAWSLAIEEQFYIVWPLVSFACLRTARWRHWALAGVCVGGAGASIAAMALLYEPGGDPSRVYYGTDTRAHGLLIGVSLAILLSSWVPRGVVARTSTRALALVAAGYMLASFVLISDTDSWMYRGGYALFHVAVAVVIVAVVQPGNFVLRRVLSLGAVVWIGRISYGLYLWHWPVIVVMSPARTGLDGATLDVARIAVTLTAASLSFYLVEQPIRRGALTRLPRRIGFAAGPTAFLCAGVAVLVATAGATPPPEFLRADPGRIISSANGAGIGSAPDTRAGASAPADAATGGDAAGPPRVLLAGDSIAHSLHPALQQAADAAGLPLARLTVAGCGIAGGIATDENGTPYDWAPTCDNEMPRAQELAIADLRPDIVLWLSVWETSDRLVDGERVRFGTKSGDKALLAEIDEAAGRLTAGGARLVLVQLPLPAEDPETPPVIDYGPDIRHLNRLLARYAAEHPETAEVYDLGEIVCPDGPPCPAEIAGVRPRPSDGIHYEGDGAAWVADQLVPRLLEYTHRAHPLGGTGPAGAAAPVARSAGPAPTGGDPTTTTTTPPASAPPAPPPAAPPPAAFPPPQRMLFVGDSVAATLADPLAGAAAAAGVAFESRVVQGCGNAASITADAAGVPYDFAAACAESIPGVHQEAVARFQPDVVVWLSVWEISNRIVGGQVHQLGTVVGNQSLTAEIDAAVNRLTAGGAHLVFVAPAPPAAESAEPYDPEQAAALQRLAAVLREYARQHADRVTVVELGGVVCPAGPPCPADVGGFRPRAGDGNHFEGSGATWVADQLFPWVVSAAAPAPAPAVTATVGVGAAG
ncbi:MAG TPA: acyltransferase family protein [Acidimicrobiia bacterium]